MLTATEVGVYKDRLSQELPNSEWLSQKRTSAMFGIANLAWQRMAIPLNSFELL